MGADEGREVAAVGGKVVTDFGGETIGLKSGIASYNDSWSLRFSASESSVVFTAVGDEVVPIIDVPSDPRLSVAAAVVVGGA
jgi:hypothetical protein